MKPLDCKGEFNKCKISIGDKLEKEILKEFLTKIRMKDKKSKGTDRDGLD